MFGKKCSDYRSELMVKDKQLVTLQEDNRLLARLKKDAQKRRQQLLEVLNYSNCTCTSCIFCRIR